MEDNTNKKIWLSILGIVILIIAIFGTTFALFQYTKIGTNNNQINTGTLVFNFEDVNGLVLDNHFPMSTISGLELSDTEDVCRFNITGKTSGSAELSYKIYAIPGTTLDGGKERFNDDEVFINIRRTDVLEGATFTGVAIYTGSNAAAIGDLTKLELGSGTITSTSLVNLTFEVRMWVDTSKVTIADVGGTYTPGEFSNLYYSMKILVEASA